MKRFVLFFLALSLFVGPAAQGATYTRIQGFEISTLWNTLGSMYSYPGPDLQSGIIYFGIQLPDASLSLADLSSSTLTGGNFSGSFMMGSDLRSSVLIGVDFSDANLNYTDLSGSVLTGARFENTSLVGADFSGSSLLGSNFSSTDVRGGNFHSATYLGSGQGTAIYDLNTDFTNAWADGGLIPFDPVAAGWVLVPEPSTALLLGMGLLAMAMPRRR